MNPDLTLDPIQLASSLDGLLDLDRIRCIRRWISRACSACASATDTLALVNGSNAVLFLYVMLDDACANPRR